MHTNSGTPELMPTRGRPCLEDDHERSDAHQCLTPKPSVLALVGHCMTDVNGRFLEINDVAERLLFGEREPGRHANFDACVVPCDRGAIVQYRKSARRMSPTLSVEARSTHVDDRTFQVYIRPAPGTDDEDVPWRFSVVVVNISERKATEARLKLLNASSQALVGSLSFEADISTMLARLQIEFAPLCFVDLKLEGRDVQRLYPAPPGSRQELDYVLETGNLFPHGEVDRVLTQVLASKNPVCTRLALAGDVRQRATQDRGTERRSMFVVPLVAGGLALGTMTCIAAAGRTYRPEDLHIGLRLAHRVAAAVQAGVLYEQAREKAAAGEKILATASHDAKNVLTSIKLRGELLTESSDAFAREQGVAIDRLCDRLDIMLNGFIDASRVKQGQLKMRSKAQCVDKLLSEAVRTHQLAASVRSLRLTSSRSGLQAYCDAAKILDVLGTLLSAAIKLSSQGSVVNLTAVAKADSVRIGVTYQGSAINTSSLEQLGVRSQHGTVSRFDSVGRSIAQDIAEAGGSDLRFRSNLDEGRTFYFTVPIAERHRAFQQEIVQVDMVLVVDDDDDLRLAACDILRHGGYRVRCARNGAEALKLSVAAPLPSLVLLDLDMPVSNGWDYLRLRERKAALRNVKVIVMSGSSVGRITAIRCGAPFLLKPLRARQLLDGVRGELLKRAYE